MVTRRLVRTACITCNATCRLCSSVFWPHSMSCRRWRYLLVSSSYSHLLCYFIAGINPIIIQACMVCHFQLKRPWQPSTCSGNSSSNRSSPSPSEAKHPRGRRIGSSPNSRRISRTRLSGTSEVSRGNADSDLPPLFEVRSRPTALHSN